MEAANRVTNLVPVPFPIPAITAMALLVVVDMILRWMCVPRNCPDFRVSWGSLTSAHEGDGVIDHQGPVPEVLRGSPGLGRRQIPYKSILKGPGGQYQGPR